MSGKTTLCWDCKKAVLGCSWARNFKSVHGWVAEKTSRILSDRKTRIRSYRVISCPEFEPDGICGGQKRFSGTRKEYMQRLWSLHILGEDAAGEEDAD